MRNAEMLRRIGLDAIAQGGVNKPIKQNYILPRGQGGDERVIGKETRGEIKRTFNIEKLCGGGFQRFKGGMIAAQQTRATRADIDIVFQCRYCRFTQGGMLLQAKVIVRGEVDATGGAQRTAPPGIGYFL